MNYKMILEYDGSRYNGWQRQGNTDNTIQGKLEEILSKYFGEEIEIHGSGRTDAGVHALGQVANFKVYNKNMRTQTRKLEANSECCGSLMFDLNKYLPEDIRIISLEVADDRFHARLNASSKTYRYRYCLSHKRNVFERKYCAMLPEYNTDTTNLYTMPDIDIMKSASLKFLGEHDFLGFSDSKTKKSTIRRVDDISFSHEMVDNTHYLTVDFTGNGFLYHTVRMMMGTLIKIGLGQFPSSIIDEIFESKDRKKVPYTSPAEGLFLVEVRY